MKTIILSTSFRILTPLFLYFSAYMFFRGHDQPGGGFIAALIAAIPFMVHGVAFGVEETKKRYRINQFMIAVVGLLVAAGSGVLGILENGVFMKPLWTRAKLPFIGEFGTPLMFDVGVFLIVFGMFLQITFLFIENIERAQS